MKIILETPRMYLAEAELTEAPFYFKLTNSEKWIKYIGDKGIRNLEDAKNYIQKSLIDNYAKYGYGLYSMVLKSSNKTIGLCGLVNRPSLEHPDIGFAVSAEYEKQGFTFEAAEAILNYAKSALQLKTILAITSPDNQASQNLLEKLGMKKEGEMKLEGYSDPNILFSINF